ncbi:MAG: phage minor head protein [Halomonas sp.]
MSAGFDFDVSPAKAIEYFREKGLQPTFDYRDLDAEEHQQAFTVAKMLDVDLLGTVRQALDTALAEGRTFEDFKAELVPTLKAKGWWGRQPVTDPMTGQTVEAELGSTRRLQTIFRSNLQDAYATGTWEKIEAQAEEAPYLLYSAIDDHRVREDHLALDGTVLPADDPFWSTFYPPNGYNCRCDVLQLSAAELEEMGLEPSSAPPEIQTRTWTNPRTGKTRQLPKGIDPGWDHNPGQVRLERKKEILQEKLQALPEDMQPANLAALLADGPEAVSELRAKAKAEKAAERAQEAEIKAAKAQLQAIIEGKAEDPGKWKQKALKQLQKSKRWSEAGPVERMAAVEKRAKELKQKHQLQAKLSGYKKRILEGKEPTPAQADALASLPEGEREKFLAKVEAEKAAQEQAAAEAKANAEAQAQLELYQEKKAPPMEYAALKKLLASGDAEDLSPAELLEAVQSKAAELKDYGKKKQLAAGYKKKVIAGENPSEKQVQAFTALSQADQDAIVEEIEAAQAEKAEAKKKEKLASEWISAHSQSMKAPAEAEDFVNGLSADEQQALAQAAVEEMGEIPVHDELAAALEQAVEHLAKTGGTDLPKKALYAVNSAPKELQEQTLTKALAGGATPDDVANLEAHIKVHGDPGTWKPTPQYETVPVELEFDQTLESYFKDALDALQFNKPPTLADQIALAQLPPGQFQELVDLQHDLEEPNAAAALGEIKEWWASLSEAERAEKKVQAQAAKQVADEQKQKDKEAQQEAQQEAQEKVQEKVSDLLMDLLNGHETDVSSEAEAGMLSAEERKQLIAFLKDAGEHEVIKDLQDIFDWWDDLDSEQQQFYINEKASSEAQKAAEQAELDGGTAGEKLDSHTTVVTAELISALEQGKPAVGPKAAFFHALSEGQKAALIEEMKKSGIDDVAEQLQTLKEVWATFDAKTQAQILNDNHSSLNDAGKYTDAADLWDLMDQKGMLDQEAGGDEPWPFPEYDPAEEVIDQIPQPEGLGNDEHVTLTQAMEDLAAGYAQLTKKEQYIIKDLADIPNGPELQAHLYLLLEKSGAGEKPLDLMTSLMCDKAIGYFDEPAAEAAAEAAPELPFPAYDPSQDIVEQVVKPEAMSEGYFDKLMLMVGDAEKNGWPPTEGEKDIFKAAPPEFQAHVYYLLEQAGATQSALAPLKEALSPEAQEYLGKTAGSPSEKASPEPEPEGQIHADALTKVGGQKGSNPGGTFLDTKTGKKWYIKTPSDPEQAKSEALAGQLYEAAGLHVPHIETLTIDGKLNIASELIEGVEQTKPQELAKLSGTLEGIAVDAWLGNWDVVGLEYDNLLRHGNKALRLDPGGALEYRAQGGMKGAAFGDKVTELETLRDRSINAQAAEVFKHATEEHIRIGVQRLAELPESTIRRLVESSGPGDKAQRNALAEKLLARRRDLIQRYLPKHSPRAKGSHVRSEEYQEIKEARQKGLSIPTDRDEIEDQETLVWHEKDLKGSPQTRAQLKVRGRAAERIESMVAQSAPGGGQGDLGQEVSKLGLTAIKGIGANASNSGLRQVDKERIWDFIDKYHDALKKAQEARNKGQLSQDDIDAWQAKAKPWVDHLEALAQKKIGEPFDPAFPGTFDPEALSLVPRASSTGLQWTQRRGMPYNWRTIEKGYAQDKGQELPSRGADLLYFEAQIEGAQVRFFPDRQGQLALKNRLEIIVPGAEQETAEIPAKVLEELGINAERPSAEDAEELYLTQILEHRRQLLAVERELGQIKDQAQRIERLKELASEGLSKRIDKFPDYDPRGERTGLGTHRHNRFRPDLQDDPGWGRFKSDYRLYHENTNDDMPSSIRNILNSGGMMASTTEKLRRGIPMGGLSPKADLRTGGADYVFTRLKTKNKANTQEGFVWKADHIARLDSISYDADRFGSVENDTHRRARKTGVKEWRRAAQNSTNEVVFKNSLSLFDGLERINARSTKDRDDIIKVFREAGYEKFPDGRALEEVIKVRDKA